MRKMIVLLLLLMIGLFGCVQTEEPVPTEDPDTENTPVYIAPELYLNHIDYAIEPTSKSLKEYTACYEVFPISFADSDGDGVGDLNGIKENLDYFVDLGVDCLWLTPITESPSYHKYDVTNYYDVDDEFGTINDLLELTSEADALGIDILMDLVINHTSKNHPWFLEHPEYYRLVEPDHPDYNMNEYWYSKGSLEYFAYFWDQMPELNLDHPDVREEIFQIAEYWVELGIDGFRLDAAKHYFDPHEYPFRTPTQNQNIIFLKELNMRVKSINPDFILLSEVWSPADVVAKYYAGVDTSFNFDLGENILAVVNGASDNSSINLVQNLIDSRESISSVREDFVDSIFLTNHDQNRVMSVLGSEPKAKLAANILFTLPGVSWIYYGEELGMTGVKPDEDIRQPMIWGNEYDTDGIGSHVLKGDNLSIAPKNALYEHYKYLIQLKSDEVLKYGELGVVTKTQRHFLAYTRTYQEQTYLIVHNLAADAKELRVDQTFEVVDMLGYSQEISETIVMDAYSTIILKIPSNVVSLPYE